MSFERHATKWQDQRDRRLVSYKNYGFSGEALASIAAVAEVGLRSRRAEDELELY